MDFPTRIGRRMHWILVLESGKVHAARIYSSSTYFAFPPLPLPSTLRPPPANQWPDDADAYWAQKNLPLVLAILCLYRYTLAALTTA